MKRLLLVPALLFCLTASAQAQTLIVSAAASLTDAFTDIEPAFEKAYPGVDVVMNFASSGALYNQIEQGAPVDVFASANVKWMDKAVEKGFAVPETNVVFARNSLVIAVPKGNRAQVMAPADLISDKVARVGIGTPETVPAGQYAKEAMTKAGLWEALATKCIFGESVRQVLDYLVRGEVDAGFVYGTDAVKAGDPVETVAEIPLDKPVTYPIAVLRQAAQGDLGRKFIAFVLSDEGQMLLIGRGFKGVE